MDTEEIVIMVGQKRAATTLQFAQMLEITPGAMRTAIRDLKARPIAYLDERTPLYDREELLRRLALRPGRGANLRARKALERTRDF